VDIGSAYETDYSAPQVAGREVPFHSAIREHLTGDHAWRATYGIAERLLAGGQTRAGAGGLGDTVEGRRVLLHLMAGSKENGVARLVRRA
jgi:hypothetical protein